MLRVCLLLMFTGLLSAQVPDPQAELIRRLLERIDALEKRVNELERPLRAAAAPVTSPAPPLPPAVMDHGDGHASLDTSPALNVRGYGDAGFMAAHAPASSTSTFGLGQFDLFLTSRLSNHIGFLAEVVFEHGPDNGTGVDLERALLQIRPSSLLNIDVGRYHSSIGYYNTAYHHGAWFQTATARPLLFRFEDEGGLLPIHNVGVSVNGKAPVPQLGLRYFVEVGNGRAYQSPSAEPVQNSFDENRGKSINAGASVAPSILPGLRLGMSLYRDKLTPAGALSVNQQIWAGYAVFDHGRTEFLNEAVWMRHQAGAAHTTIPGWYSQFAYRFGTVKPYLRWEWMNLPGSDPVVRWSNREHGVSQSASGGIRYDFTEFAAFKLQLGREMRPALPARIVAAAQLSFAF